MKLHEISSHDELTQQVTLRMMERATVLHYAEFYPIAGNTEYARKTATASGGQFRALNTNFPNNVISPAFANPALKILGDIVQVDQAHERRGGDVASVRASELLNFAGNLGKQVQNYFFNGDTDVSVNQFDGMKKLITGAQKITASTNGLSVDLGNSDTAKMKQQKFLELIDQLIGTVEGGAQVLFMDNKTLSRLSSIAREYITTTTNRFGVPVKYYNGIPVETAGYDKDGNHIINQAETCGSANNCTSIYAVRFGERADVTLPTNIGVEVLDQGLISSFYTHRVELDLTLAVLNDKAAARLEGIILA